jgi:hypothetical protein
MNGSRFLSTALLIAAAVASLAPAVSIAQYPTPFIVATGLEAPRGLRFGPDGDLYIAEAGTGGTTSTAGKCAQVAGPPGGPGPYTGGSTGRISKVDRKGTLTTVATGFASSQDVGGDLLGVADVAFLNGTLYALIAGGGCSHGNLGNPSGVAQVNRTTGQWHRIANLSAFVKANPTAFPGTDDFEPDETFYSLLASVDHGLLYVVGPNHGEVLSVDPSGTIDVVIDISASQGHIVPTSIAERDGSLFVGNLNLFPIDPQWARIQTISTGFRGDEDFAPGFASDYRGFHIVDSKAGFTTVVAVDFGPDGLLYVLELSDAPGFPTPNAGKVVRVRPSGALEDVVTGLSVPTGMTFGPDGRLYVSNLGAAPLGAGAIGQVLRFDIAPGE